MSILYGILLEEKNRLEKLIKFYKVPEEFCPKSDAERALPPGEWQARREKQLKKVLYNLGEIKVALEAIDEYKRDNYQEENPGKVSS